MEINILKYCVHKIFKKDYGVKTSPRSNKYVAANNSAFDDMDLVRRRYYKKYAKSIVDSLAEYIDNIVMLDINPENGEPDESYHYDFKLTWGDKNYITPVSLDFKSLKLTGFIPEKLMKVCSYRGNTNVAKEFNKNYKDYTKTTLKKISRIKEYSSINDKDKKKLIFDPFTKIVFNCLVKKRKGAKNMYENIFNDTDRIIIKISKNKYTIYDFNKNIPDVKSYSMKILKPDEILLSFSNGVKILLSVKTNAKMIGNKVSIKLHPTIYNIDDIFEVVTIDINDIK